MSPTYFKFILLGLILLEYAWSLVTHFLTESQRKKPLPDCVKGIYDDEQYARWVAYTKEKKRMGFYHNIFMTLFTLAVFAFDAFAWVYNAIGVTGTWGAVILMLVFSVVSKLLELPTDYYFTFVIEEKYGFNKSTKKTFWFDQLKNLILGVILNTALMLLAYTLQKLMGMWMALGLFVILMLIMVITSFFSLFFQKLFYKFTPLPEGELRDRLMGLFAAHGYTAKEIYVMNASKRTTRANAFCTGLGKGKKIALFDNLVEGYTEDEITAVFAHELGHAKHRDTLKLVGLQAIIYAAMSLLITFMLTSETVSLALGFVTYNAAGAFIALSAVVLGPVMTILMAPINILSRRFERAADTFAVDNGLGDPLVDALTRLHRDSLADLNPHPFLSAIGDSHPTLGERIQVVRSAQERRGERGSKSDAS